MILKGEALCKSYGEEIILDSTDLEIRSGESVAITGESGSGKSTLISVMGLLLGPDSGSVCLDGTDLLALDDRGRSKIRNSNFGFIFQHTQLIGSVTVFDNVLIPALIAGKRGMEDEARKLLDDLGLSHRIGYYPHQLSIGQKRRVTLARALLLEPDIIFADEPTNDLDAENVELVGDRLFSLADQGRALVVVTHDSELAKRADRIISI